VPPGETKAKFIEPMLLLPSETLPEWGGWTYELKLDGYRASGIKSAGAARLRSRNDELRRKYPAITRVLEALPGVVEQLETAWRWRCSIRRP
jgi:bifunctional non-homologous end joining protein LigD